MTFALPKKTRILWQIRISFVFAVLYAPLVVFCRHSPIILLPTTVVVTIGSVFVFVYATIYLKRYKITVDKSGVCLTKGLIIKTVVIVPYARLAFIKSFSTPLAALLKLKCTMLKVSRGWLIIPEIESEQAECLIKMMQND